MTQVGHVVSGVVARYLDIHPDNPQQRLLQQVVDALNDDALIAYPTDSGYALCLVCLAVRRSFTAHA